MSQSRGLYGSSFDRQVERYDDSGVSKMQQRYWQAKQTFIRKLKRKEDDCIVASDSELDSKLELFRAIEDTCTQLLYILESYQDRLYCLAHEENSTGRFLKEASKVDKTRAGKMMLASGKTLSYTAQQRIQLQHPLARLYSEVETFQYRAIVDTYETINKMEKARTAYRAALLWMKDVSAQLDPDTYKQLEKFRRVQGHVRRTKIIFDRIKLDTIQKIDMLSASRCNLFSHSLAGYQSAWLLFWDKTSRTMNTVAETFKGYQYYEWNIVKELAEPSKQLANDKTSSARDDDFQKILGEDDKDRLIFFDAEYKDDEEVSKSLQEMEKRLASKKKPKGKAKEPSNGSEQVAPLLDLGQEQPVTKNQSANASSSLTQLLQQESNLLDDIFSPVVEPSTAASGANGNLLEDSNENAFLPSHLLEQAFGAMNLNKSSAHTAPKQQTQATKESANNSWLNLFAELDPLANPDAIGKEKGENDRNC